MAILFGVNELLEGMGMEKARRSMEELLKVAPKEAVLLKDGEERVVPIASLKVGDIVLVKSGQKIPCRHHHQQAERRRHLSGEAGNGIKRV